MTFSKLNMGQLVKKKKKRKEKRKNERKEKEKRKKEKEKERSVSDCLCVGHTVATDSITAWTSFWLTPTIR